MSEATVVRFPDRRSAYGFVSEIRRLYDLDRWVSLRVQRVEEHVLVELPASGFSPDVAAIARRHGGSEPTSVAEGERLREALAQAYESERASRRSAARGHDTVERADPAVGRRANRERPEPTSAD